MADENTSPPLSPRQRRLRALELRKAGASYTQIARQLGISPRRAMSNVQRALSELARFEDQHQREGRQLESERLELAMLSLVQHVRDGDSGAIDRWLRLCESRRKLLGLDASASHATTSTAGTHEFTLTVGNRPEHGEVQLPTPAPVRPAAEDD